MTIPRAALATLTKYNPLHVLQPGENIASHIRWMQSIQQFRPGQQFSRFSASILHIPNKGDLIEKSLFSYNSSCSGKKEWKNDVLKKWRIKKIKWEKKTDCNRFARLKLCDFFTALRAYLRNRTTEMADVTTHRTPHAPHDINNSSLHRTVSPLPRLFAALV